MNFEQSLTYFIPKIEAEMRRLMAPPNGALDPLFGMLHYHLGWVDAAFQPIQVASGKLLRPIFTLLCCQAAGAPAEKALTVAAVIELIHNYSLIHDDIEDNSRTRRGRTTVWAIWGEPQAINAGDALLVIARHALLELYTQGAPPQTIFEVIDRLDMDCMALCRGQYLDMSFEQTSSVDLQAYLEMIEGKTAALLACSGYLGGLIATNSPAKSEIFRQLGRTLGLAFQIHDDLLGVWGQEAVTGKPAADDLRRRKKSLPVVFALNQTTLPQAIRFREIYAASTMTEADVAEAIAILEAIGAKTYTETQARTYIAQAESALQAIEATPENKQSLEEMAHFLIERVK